MKGEKRNVKKTEFLWAKKVMGKPDKKVFPLNAESIC